MNVALASLVQRKAEILFTDLDDTVVMMDSDEGNYYELDAVGTRIWNLLDNERSVAEVCELLVREYDVTLEDCRQDVLKFLEQVAQLGVVEVRGPEP